MDRSNKYLFTSHRLCGGGSERVVSLLASHMAADGYDVSVLAYKRTEQDYPLGPGVKLSFMPEIPDSLWGKVRQICIMRQLIDKRRPDVILTFAGPGLVPFVPYLASRRWRTPIVRTVRNSPWVRQKDFIRTLCWRYFDRRAAAIMVQNEEQIAFFPKKLRNKIFVVPNPVSDEILVAPKTEYNGEIVRMIAVGRLVAQKNYSLLLSALAKLRTEFPNITLDIYGQGPEEESLRSQIRELGLEGHCRLAGHSGVIQDALRGADLFVMTSRHEGMPNALMEAMAVGLPCISSDCRTGPKTLIDSGKNGLLFAAGDEADLMEKLRYALTHPTEMADMGRKARSEILKNYTYDTVYNSLLRMLEAI